MTFVQDAQPRGSLEQTWDHTIDGYIEHIYRTAFSLTPNKFQEWALAEFQWIVPFDAALWGRYWKSNWSFDALTTLVTSETLLPELEQSHQAAPFVQSVLANPTNTGDACNAIPDSNFLISKLYEQCAKRRTPSPECCENNSECYYTLTLYRKNSEEVFSERDRQHQRQAAFHLLSAISLAWLLHSTHTHSEQPSTSAMAVVNSSGTYDEVHPSFPEILEKHFPNHRSNTLPFPLPAKGKTIVINRLCIRYEPQPDFSCIFIWSERALDRLTQREREVVTAITHGLSFKKTAQHVGISPSSAANHLYRVYTKLGVFSRSELAELVHASHCRR